MFTGAKMRPGGGRKSSQKAGGYGRNRGGSSARGGTGGDMTQYWQNGKLSLDDISTFRIKTSYMLDMRYLLNYLQLIVIIIRRFRGRCNCVTS